MTAATARRFSSLAPPLFGPEVDPLGTPANQRVRTERPDYEEYGRRNFLACPPEAYAGLVRDIVRQPDGLEELKVLGITQE